MFEKFCGSCGGVRIGDSKFCIICGSKFSTEQVRKCPTCNQDWPDAPNMGEVPTPPPSPAPPASPSVHRSSALTNVEVQLEESLNMLARPIKWADSLAKGKDCLNCGCPDSATVCTVCGFIR